MNASLLLRLVLVIGLVAATSCKRQSPPPAPTPVASSPEAPALRTFQVRGVVQELRPADRVVVVQHEAIPDYMAAMTMPFDVKDLQELDGLKPGDAIAFQMQVLGDEDAWIEQVRKLAPGTNGPPAGPTPHVRVVRDVDELGVGDRLPDYRFTNELGQAVSLSEFKGQVVALTFIYTRCPYPDFCPRTSRQFSETQQSLTAHPNAPRQWRLLSVSFDPDHDTPATLLAYARRQNYSPTRWSFLTGAIIDIDAITEQFGMLFTRDATGLSFDHTLRTAVIDPAGRIRKIFVGNQWKSGDLVAEMLQAAQPER